MFLFSFFLCVNVKTYQDGVFDQLILDTSDGCIQLRSQCLQCKLMHLLSQELHKTLEIVQRSPAVFSVSGHEHILHRIYLDVAAHWRSASIPRMRQISTISTGFLFSCIFNCDHFVKR